MALPAAQPSGSKLPDDDEIVLLFFWEVFCAERINAAGKTVFGLESTNWGALPKEDWRKGLRAGSIRDSSLAPNSWVAERVAMGSTGAVSRTIRQARELTKGKRKVRSQVREIEQMSICSD
jgi:hypothetical protein